jgi:hypothetical protein
MTKYTEVAGSRGLAPRFSVTVGLQEGYGPDGILHTEAEVAELVWAHLKAAAAAGKPFLTGAVSGGTLVYAWPEGPGAAGGGSEPQAVYSGNINPLYNADMSDEDIRAFLSGLAAELGTALGQTRVYVEFDREIWILQAEEKETPTGE